MSATKTHTPTPVRKAGRAWTNDEGRSFPAEQLHRYECSCGWKGLCWYAAEPRSQAHFERHRAAVLR